MARRPAEMAAPPMVSPAPCRRRQRTDILKLMGSQHRVTVVEHNQELIVHFQGPADSPYQNGVWKVRVHLTDKYPLKSPSVGFVTRIFHPNIDEASGSVCLDVLNQCWVSAYDLNLIFDIFLPQLLLNPNPYDPLNDVAARLLQTDPDAYWNTVETYVAKYAKKEPAPRRVSM